MINERGIINQYDLVIYPHWFVVVVGDMEKEVNARYKPQEADFNWVAKPSGDVSASTYTLLTKKNECPVVLIWFKTFDDFLSSTNAHECGHAALEIFKHIGAKMNYNDQEPFCYLLGNLSRLATKTYWQYKDFLDKQTKTENNVTKENK